MDGVINNGETGADCGGPCLACACPSGNCALRFDGIDDFVSVPSSPTLHGNAGALTVEAWIYFDDLGNCQTIARKGTASFPYDYWLHKNFAPDDSIYWAGSFSLVAFSAVAPAVWHHIAGVYDPAAASARVYVDGVLQSSLVVSAIPQSNNDDLRIGIDWDFGCPFDGVIDEIRISSVARYSENFVPPAVHGVDASTKALYHFDEYQGSVVHDVSGNGNHGISHGATWTLEHP